MASSVGWAENREANGRMGEGRSAKREHKGSGVKGNSGHLQRATTI